MALEDFQAACKEVFPKGNAEKFSTHLFRHFDEDASGRLDFREKIHAGHCSPTEGQSCGGIASQRNRHPKQRALPWHKSESLSTFWRKQTSTRTENYKKKSSFGEQKKAERSCNWLRIENEIKEKSLMKVSISS
ncbi:hypothetical protein CAPTEDRAFT_209448 [Capitella teleta]|uniref:EF-hand domain-containing protein n=1 Tax=Capitella teleta TaxID=283909 RepID=R7UMX6_CAPTE|nr:hypothetical protein CAPTEDRAFT_209448 [Capitella teleta]|eukprot:ELU07448.1 hypothetical protein CAPTEDRAFT_209448 [Capitella teleta]